MYHLFALLVAIFPGLHVLARTTTTLSYDNNYDNADLSLDLVACSDGSNGLKTKHYTTLGSLHNFPLLGGVYTVSSWNSAHCGACYAVTYGSNTVNILAVDHSATGFTVSEAAMDKLTDGQAYSFGRVDVSFVPVDASKCGIY